MARIKIEDLPEKVLTKEEMQKVYGGLNPQPEPPLWYSGSNPLYLNTNPLSSSYLKIDPGLTTGKF